MIPIKKRTKKEKMAASITIHEPDRMTHQGRKDIATWLRKQANMLIKEGDNYSTHFRAAYYYIEK